MDKIVLAQRALEAQPILIGEVHVRLTSLTADVEDNIPLFDQHIMELITKSRISEIFALMRRMKVWDPLNYRVLTVLLRKCVPLTNEVHDHFHQYSFHVEEFKRTTLLRDYMAVCGSTTSHPHGCTTITVKFERKYNEYTLALFAEDQAFIENEFLLHQSLLRFKESQRGCIGVTWFIPRKALPLLKPPLKKEKREALKNRGIVELIIDEKYIYRVRLQ